VDLAALYLAIVVVAAAVSDGKTASPWFPAQVTPSLLELVELERRQVPLMLLLAVVVTQHSTAQRLLLQADKAVKTVLLAVVA